MNEVDLLIILILGLGVYHGVKRGILSGVIDLASLLVALALASLGWRVAAGVLKWFGFPDAMAGALGFILLGVGITIGAGHLGVWLVRTLQPPRWADRIGGGAVGALFGLLLSALLLMFSGILPQAQAPLQRSALGPGLIRLVPAFHSSLERGGITLPKLVMLPADYRDELSGVRRGLQFMQINFSRLEGATCMKCRQPVHFLGYQFRRGTLLSPKFRCPNCGRTTDGCQTFEGFHRIYGRCPVDLAREGVRFDCGVWPNGDFILPKGPCPVEGNKLDASYGQTEAQSNPF